MTVTPEQRARLERRLREVLGDDAATTLLALLDAARPPGTAPLGRAAVNPERESESRELPLVTSMRQVVRAEIGAVHHDLETSLARRRREEVLALVAVSALTVAVSTAVLVLAAPTLGRSS